VTDPLSTFAPAVRTWFAETFGTPTPPQALGWPPIQRGEHTLILSPTGSGKTLAAFLWGINRLYTELAADEGPEGVELLYISPLKALNNDIERNLRVPRAGIRQVARRLGEPDPDIRVMVRTGDTPQAARASMVKHPPHILITTPESLYLILTSPAAREMLRSVRTVIVDEIHTLCGNKRGVHLALSLERLEHLADEPPQRIGLSATQRPLDEVARFLGGYDLTPAPSPARRGEPPSPSQGEGRGEGQPRPVTIVDAGTTKPLDLQVVTVARDFADLPGGSIWPLVIPRTLNLIRQHHTTLVYANSRRQAERAADRLNEQFAVESEEEGPPDPSPASPDRGPGPSPMRGGETPPSLVGAKRGAGGLGSPTALLRDGVPVGQGFMGTGRVGGPFRAHHGSVSKEMRLELESDLKAGRLPALIGTSSLELSIDIGSVDLVVQLGSPKGVARGLQRVGRSGHLVGQTSKGRFFPLFKEDLVECGALAGAMRRGDVEPTTTPQAAWRASQRETRFLRESGAPRPASSAASPTLRHRHAAETGRRGGGLELGPALPPVPAHGDARRGPAGLFRGGIARHPVCLAGSRGTPSGLECPRYRVPPPSGRGAGGGRKPGPAQCWRPGQRLPVHGGSRGRPGPLFPAAVQLCGAAARPTGPALRGVWRADNDTAGSGAGRCPARPGVVSRPHRRLVAPPIREHVERRAGAQRPGPAAPGGPGLSSRATGHDLGWELTADQSVGGRAKEVAMKPGCAYSDRYEDALRQAAKVHLDHKRKGSDVPYITHVVYVSLILLHHGFSEDVAMAGLLHDAVEDRELPLSLIEAQFGSQVAEMVSALSEHKTDAQGHKRPWETRKRESLEHLRQASAEAVAVKAADVLHNARSTALDLRQDGPTVGQRFTRGLGPLLDYYRQTARVAGERLGDHPLVDELADAVEDLARAIKEVGADDERVGVERSAT